MYAPLEATIAPMHKTIDKILAELMSKSGLNQADLSRMANVGQPTISRILKPNGPKGIKEPSDKQVRPLAEFFGVSTDQLRGYAPLESSDAGSAQPKEKPVSSMDAVRDMLARATKIPEHLKQKILEAAERPAEQSNVVKVDFSRPGQVGDEVWIAHYDVRGAMGAGQVPHDYPETFQDVRVSPSHLRELGVQFKEHFHLKMISGQGESMAPTIKSRDPLLVDVTIREFTGDGIYVLTWQQHFYIKRLQILDEDHFEMISDHPGHKPRTIRRDDTYIQGRVLYVWNGQPV